jgi:hypothetical protein
VLRLVLSKGSRVCSWAHDAPLGLRSAISMTNALARPAPDTDPAISNRLLGMRIVTWIVVDLEQSFGFFLYPLNLLVAERGDDDTILVEVSPCALQHPSDLAEFDIVQRGRVSIGFVVCFVILDGCPGGVCYGPVLRASAWASASGL